MYYDVDDILTDAQKVPCQFELDVPGLGYIDGNTGGDVSLTGAAALPYPRVLDRCNQLKKGAKVELPLWLGEMLAVSQPTSTGALVTLDLPAALSQRVMNALKADPRTVDLRAQAPHFYALAARMLELFEEDEMVDVLIETFKKRSAEIADQAHNPRGALGEGADFLRGLDETERQLFKSAHGSAKSTRSWMADMKKH